MIDDSLKEESKPFLRLNFTTLWVRDQERSRRFFVDQLGFQVIVDVEAPDKSRWIVVAPSAPHWLNDTAGASLSGIAIVVPAEGSPECLRIGQYTGLSFLTDDVQAVFRAWSHRGVRFTQPPTIPAWGSGQAQHALFQDVEENTFSLFEFDEATRTVESERRAQVARREAEHRAAQELEIAKEVQSRLFPQARPAQRTLAYSGMCIQAREVGGDYFDFLDLGQERLGLVIADIAGKGIAGALLMANLQANFRSQSALALHEPQRMLRSVNQLFYENTADSAYSTLLFAEYDGQTGRLRYANCGHLPALLLRADGSVERLSATGTVLGLFKHWDCTIETSLLAPGDILALYTDGVTEAFNQAEEEFGEQRLIDVLRRHRDLPPDDLLSAILGEIREFSHSGQHDDITVIVAKCRGND